MNANASQRWKFGLIESTVECGIKIDNISVMFAQFLAMIKRISL